MRAVLRQCRLGPGERGGPLCGGLADGAAARRRRRCAGRQHIPHDRPQCHQRGAAVVRHALVRAPVALAAGSRCTSFGSCVLIRPCLSCWCVPLWLWLLGCTALVFTLAQTLFGHHACAAQSGADESPTCIDTLCALPGWLCRLHHAFSAKACCGGLGVQATGKEPSHCAAAALALTPTCKVACNYNNAQPRHALSVTLNPFSGE